MSDKENADAVEEESERPAKRVKATATAPAKGEGKKGEGKKGEGKGEEKKKVSRLATLGVKPKSKPAPALATTSTSSTSAGSGGTGGESKKIEGSVAPAGGNGRPSLISRARLNALAMPKKRG
jgi:hypothetical protein